MALIHVPKPKNAYNPNRPMSSLLRSQIDHLQEAELKLPLEYCSKLYTRAIKTEGQAARYIREVTEAIHRAHNDAERARARKPARRKGVIEIAAAADVRSERKRARKRNTTRRKKSGSSKKSRK